MTRFAGGDLAKIRGVLGEREIAELSFFVGSHNLLHCFNAVIDLDPKDGHEIVFESLAD